MNSSDQIQPDVGFRLSPLQQEIWQRTVGTQSTPSLQVEARCAGALRPDMLEQAIRNVVTSNEILRTSFQVPAGEQQPLQVINANPVTAPVIAHDLSSMPEPERSKRKTELADSAVTGVADLNQGGLFRADLLTFSPHELHLILTASALCVDRESLKLLVRQIGEAYEALLDQRRLPMASPQFADVAEWQWELVEERGEEESAFWQYQSTASHQLSQLPCERATSHASISGTLETTQVTDLNQWTAMGSDERAAGSDHALLLAAWCALLSRLTSEEQIGCSTYCDGRFLPDLKKVVGPLGRFLPIITRVDPEETFAALVSEVRKTVDDAQQWQFAFHFNADSVGLDESSVTDFLSPSIGFSFQQRPHQVPISDTGFSLKKCRANPGPTRLWLECEVANDRLGLTLHYDGQRFEEGDGQRMLAQFVALLRSAMEDPSRRIGDLDLLSEQEHQELIVRFNDTATDYSAEQCIHRIFERHAQQFPESVAIESGERSVTYSELNNRANRLAHFLKARGVRPNVLVGICLERSVEMVVSILGVLKAGGAYVPMDPGYPPERLEFMLTDTQAPLVVTRDCYSGHLPRYNGEVVYLDRDTLTIDEQSSENLADSAAGEDLVYVIYTSGSTGKPKGVRITHEGLVISNSARIAFFKRPVKKFLLLSSFSFDSSVVGIFWSLSTGGCLLLVEENLQRDLRELVDVIASRKVSHLLTLPSYYSMLLEHADPGKLDELETSIVAGEPCPGRMVDMHRQLLPTVELFSEYGATETTVFNSVYDCLEQTLDTAPIGRPVDNAEIYVLDSRMKPVPTGVVGEAFFGGRALSPGYLNRPDLNAEKFVPSPFSNDPNARLYRSGDLLRHHPNGDVEFVGRVDNQVKIRGFRIELEEIESVLLQHELVREAAVLAIERADWSGSDTDSPDSTSGGKRLAAYVSATERHDSLTSQLRQLLTDQLPDYMMPSAFIVLPVLPKHPNGKIDRSALPSPGTVQSTPRLDVVNARSVEEEQFIEIWKDVLGLEQVGIHDNFFEMGGDSILSIQVVSRANQIGIAITPMQLFQYQTIAELVAHAKSSRVINAEQDEVTGPVPLTPIHHWFRDRESPDPAHWNMPLLLELQSEPDIADLQTAVSALVRHHDVLRLSCRVTRGQWCLEIMPFNETRFVSIVDMATVPADEVNELIRLKAAEFQKCLSLEDGRLMQLVVFELGPARKNLLFWNLHHLAGDIVSWQILMEDLELALEQIQQGEAVKLAEKSTSFQHWARSLNQYAQSRDVLQEADFWLSAERKNIDALPLDHEAGRENNTEESLTIHRVSLTHSETDQLLRVAPKFYSTQINEVLLTALHLSLQKWTGSSSSLIDVELHGREEDCFDDVDLSRTVGWFTSYYPMLLSGSNNTSPTVLLSSVKQQMRAVPNRGFHFGLLRYLQEDREINERFARLPAAEINFNYLGQFGQAVEGTDLFRLVNHQTTYGMDRSPRGLRSHLIEVVSWVVEDRLQIDFSYSVNAHSSETIAGLATEFLESLRLLIAGSQAHSDRENTRVSAEVVPNEPEDAPEFDFGWDNADLADIRKAIAKAKESH